MAEQLFVSEGVIVDAAGSRIADLVDLAYAEKLTALENRIAKLENERRGPTPEVPPETTPLVVHTEGFGAKGGVPANG